MPSSDAIGPITLFLSFVYELTLSQVSNVYCLNFPDLFKNPNPGIINDGFVSLGYKAVKLDVP